MSARRHTALALAVAAAALAPVPGRGDAPDAGARPYVEGGMLLVARGPSLLTVFTSVDQDGAGTRLDRAALQEQAEQAMWRCGFTVEPAKTGTLLAVNVSVLGKGLAHAASVRVQLSTQRPVEGVAAWVEAFAESALLAGPPAGATVQVRDALGRLLDHLCAAYGAAKTSAAAGEPPHP